MEVGWGKENLPEMTVLFFVAGKPLFGLSQWLHLNDFQTGVTSKSNWEDKYLSPLRSSRVIL